MNGRIPVPGDDPGVSSDDAADQSQELDGAEEARIKLEIQRELMREAESFEGGIQG